MDYNELPIDIKEKINKYKEMCIRIKCCKQKTTLYNSKFGGIPYFPAEGVKYPCSEDGEPLKLLAQINFKEMPVNSIFPTEGLLQFYISPSDDVHGLDFDNALNQDKFKVIYFKEIIEDRNRLLSDFSFVEGNNCEYFPIQNEVKLNFELDSNDIGIVDFQLEELFQLTTSEIGDKYGKDILDYFDTNCLGEGHKSGGFAYFTQEDPRGYTQAYSDHKILLLQIDSDSANNIWWGDNGVANFFIRPRDLKELNFTQVLYNWDCF